MSRHVEQDCTCIDGSGYSRRFLAFVRAHQEQFESAYVAPSQGTASNELARLQREFQTLPPRHICTCPKLNRQGVWAYHCLECRKASEAINRQDFAQEMGRSTVPGSRVPMVVMLDLEGGMAA